MYYHPTGKSRKHLKNNPIATMPNNNQYLLSNYYMSSLTLYDTLYLIVCKSLKDSSFCIFSKIRKLIHRKVYSFSHSLYSQLCDGLCIVPHCRGAMMTGELWPLPPGICNQHRRLVNKQLFNYLCDKSSTKWHRVLCE